MSRTAVLLVNLGSPQAPTSPAVRAYLREFLWDPRVVEIPRPLWWLVLHMLILPTRPAASARKYGAIWDAEGSPLRVHTEKQAKLLRGYLGHFGADIVVDCAMRYGEPAVADALDRLTARGCGRILVVPLYPQYAASTTASAFDAVAAWTRRTRDIPELRFVRSFPDDAGYIAALAASVREHWMARGKPQQLIMSFHGVPRFTIDRGDPYQRECRTTARLLADALGLHDGQWQLTFQSRFGRAEWLQPYTQPTLEALAAVGTQRVDVICPGFLSDCLETLEEIAIECKSAFLAHGGREFHFIPCLNERHDWIAALAQLVSRHVGDWLEAPARAQRPHSAPTACSTPRTD